VKLKHFLKIFSEADPCTPNPCNGGKCVIGGPEGFKCVNCPQGTTGKHCDGMR